MTASTARTSHARLDYLDGLRGAAAMQVVLGHCVLAFAPGSSASLGFAADANFAVLLFFVMSGFVLTFSFERGSQSVSAAIAGRVVRLGVPLAVISMLAFAVLHAAPPWRESASLLSGSGWLSGKADPSVARALMDATGLTMFFGTAQTTLFGAAASLLPSVESSPDGPTWSLHIEFWGSLLVLALVWIQRASGTLYVVALLASAVFLGGNALGLFAVGSFAAVAMRTAAAKRLAVSRFAVIAAWAAVIAAVAVATYASLPGVWFTERLFSTTELFSTYEWFHWNKQIAAVLFFGGLLFLPGFQRVLATSPLRWLGRMSFSVYLLHVPVVMTIGCMAYLHAAPLGGRVGALAATLAVALTTLLLAVPFERLVDRPAVRWSRTVRTERGSADGAPLDQPGGKLIRR